jgi:putative transposase
LGVRSGTWTARWETSSSRGRDCGRAASSGSRGAKRRGRPATVSRTAQRWFVSFTVEAERDQPAGHVRPGTAIGIDLGVKTLLTGVDDEGRVIAVAGPRPLRAALRRLRRASRAHSRKLPGSARRRLGRIHARVAGVRADALHKASTGLAARYETIVAEDLNVTGMIANKKLARAVADQGFGKARRMLGYKTEWNGGTLLSAGTGHQRPVDLARMPTGAT